jgi:hypothetical protein
MLPTPGIWSCVTGKPGRRFSSARIGLKSRDSPGGYLDRYFDGWINPREFRLLDAAAVSRLLVTYIDDARAADNLEALRVLEQAET